MMQFTKNMVRPLMHDDAYARSSMFEAPNDLLLNAIHGEKRSCGQHSR